MRDGEVELIPVEAGLRTLAEILGADEPAAGEPS